MGKVYFTVLQLAEICGVRREAAYGLVQFLESKHFARMEGTLPKSPGQKGKGQYVYSMDVEETLEKLGETFQLLKDETKTLGPFWQRQ